MSLKLIYQDLTLELVFPKASRVASDFAQTHTDNFLFTQPTPSAHTYNQLYSIESKKMYQQLYTELKRLFSYEKPRLWKLSIILVQEVTIFSINLPFFNYKTLKRSKFAFERLSTPEASFNSFNQTPSPVPKKSTEKDAFMNHYSFFEDSSKASEGQTVPIVKQPLEKMENINQTVIMSNFSSLDKTQFMSYSNEAIAEVYPDLLITQDACRELLRHMWFQQLIFAQTIHIESIKSKASSRTRNNIWNLLFLSSFHLTDLYLGSGKFKNGPQIISRFSLLQDLDPSLLLSENLILPQEMQLIVDICVTHKRRLARIAFPPDTSWPMVSQASRPHTEKHIYDQVGYSSLRESLSPTELERGPSAEKYISELLFQRASIDEIYASIRNHRMLKKKSLKEIEKQTYLTPVNVELARKATWSGVPDSFSTSASEVNIRELEKIEDSKLLLDALISKIEYTIKSIQQNSDFSKTIELSDLNQTKPSVPKHLRFWEIMNEIADQLFFFVQAKALSYSDVHQRLYSLVLKDNNEISSIPSLKKDNSIIWLLLQLFHVEKVNLGYISKDFAGEENILGDFLDLYNEDQILSKDAFYLRDMALQSALSHQQQNIKDRSGMRFRHPKIKLVMPFTQSFYMIQTDFGNNYKKNIIDGNYTLFQNQPFEEIIKVSTISQARQYVVPNTVYGYLIPFKYDPQPFIKSGLQYLKGGVVSHLLLDYLNVGSKHRLLQLIYKMMLAHEQGPVFQFQFGPTNHSINCVSPHVLDVVYKLLYSSPYTNELMMKEILEKLRRCDQAMALGNAHFSNATIIWLYTVYQLLNARLLRFFKYYAHAGHLVHHLRHSLIFSKNPMLYTTLECFALCLTKLQYDTEFLVALLNPHYDGIPITSHPQNLPEEDPDHVQELIRPKHFWFDCTLLYRNAVMTISRITLIKGVADNPGFRINDCLASLSGRPSNWAVQVLQFMAPPVRDYFIWLKTHDKVSITLGDVLLILNDEKINPLLNDTLEDPKEIEAAVDLLVGTFSTSPAGQKLFFCVLWQLEYFRHTENKATSVRYISNVRKVLLRFRMALKTEQVAIIMDYIVINIRLQCDHGESGGVITQGEKYEKLLKDYKNVLEMFVWKYMFLKNEHVLYGLVRGETDLRYDTIRADLIKYLLVDSPGFSERLNYWKELDFPGRYWVADDYFTKQKSYLDRYPEFFEYEAYLVTNNEIIKPPVNLALPMFYENCMVRLVPVLEYAIDRLIEAEHSELLINLLNHLSMAFRLNQTPLSSLYNTLFVYYGSTTLYNRTLLKSLVLSMLDLSQQEFTQEFEKFIKSKPSESVAKDEHKDTATDLNTNEKYILSLFDKIGLVLIKGFCSLSLKPGLPEIHYREIPNPVLLALNECTVEALVVWCLSQEKNERLLSPIAGIDPNAKFSEVKGTIAGLIDEWRSRLAKRAEGWDFAKIWLKLIFKVSLTPSNQRYKDEVITNAKCKSVTYLHVTGIFANSMPSELMTAPYIRFLTDMLLFSKELVLPSKKLPKLQFSFVESGDMVSNFEFSNFGWSAARSDSDVNFSSSDIFENFVHNIKNGTQNLPNVYLTLLHSILHYGCEQSFYVLAETIKALAKGTPYIVHNKHLSPEYIDYGTLDENNLEDAKANYALTTDIQLLYICSTVAPILYRLQQYPELFAEIVENIFIIFANISTQLFQNVPESMSTDAIEIVVNFLCFTKAKFLPELKMWKDLGHHLNKFPVYLRKSLAVLVYD